MEKSKKISFRLFVIATFILNVVSIWLFTPEKSGMVFGVSIIFLLAYEYVDIVLSLMDW